MKVWKISLITIITVFILVCVSLHIYSTFFTAPGCTKGITGCPRSTKIFLVKTNPNIDCLNFEQNGCNGGFGVENQCNSSVFIDGFEVEANSKMILVFYQEEEEGYFFFGLNAKTQDEFNELRMNGNLSGYEPEKLDKFVLDGSYQDEKFVFSFYRTGNLC
jgi:hypothetical protein